MADPRANINDGILVEYTGVVANTGLYGIACMQTFLYFVHHHKYDGWFLKLLVAYLWVLNTAHQAWINRGFWVLISRVHDPFILSQEYLWAGVFTALIALTVQLFFVHRIWRLSRGHWLGPLLFIPCSLFQFAGYIAFLVLCLHGGPTASIIFAIQNLPIAFWSVGAAEDIAISLALFYFIWNQRITNGFAATNSILQRLSILALNTGAWTALCGLFVIITLVAYPHIQAYVSLNFVIAPLYVNTLLANLNARSYIRGGSTYNEPNSTDTHVVGKVSTIAFAPGRTNTSQGDTTLDPRDDLSEPTFAANSSYKMSELKTTTSTTSGTRGGSGKYDPFVVA